MNSSCICPTGYSSMAAGVSTRPCKLRVRFWYNVWRWFQAKFSFPRNFVIKNRGRTCNGIEVFWLFVFQSSGRRRLYRLSRSLSKRFSSSRLDPIFLIAITNLWDILLNQLKMENSNIYKLNQFFYKRLVSILLKPCFTLYECLFFVKKNTHNLKKPLKHNLCWEKGD